MKLSRDIPKNEQKMLMRNSKTVLTYSAAFWTPETVPEWSAGVVACTDMFFILRDIFVRPGKYFSFR